MEQRIYEKLADLFPQVASGEYSHLRLEAGDSMMPLSLEWIGRNRLSVMHTYTRNGDLRYAPVVVLEVDRAAKTAAAIEFAESFRSIANQLAVEYNIDNAREIRYRAEESFLADFDDENLAAAFETALTNSIAYTLMSRCGFDTAEHFDDDDFQFIFEFNTPDMVYALGTATGELSQQVLRDVELVIKKYERQKAVEMEAQHESEANLHAGRGLSPAGHETERTAARGDGTVGQVRKNTESVPERPSDDDVQLDADERNAVPAPAGDRGSSSSTADSGDESADGEESAARQGGRSDGVDVAHEYAEGASGGTRPERLDLRLSGPPEPLREAIAKLQQQLDDVLSGSSERLKWTEHFKKFDDLAQLDRRMVINLIQSVRIVSKTEIIITFNYQAEYETALEIARREAA